MGVVSIIISIVALIVSILSFVANNAKHNLQQLQNQYHLFCDKFQALLNLGNYNGLTNFKYELENLAMIDYYEIESANKYNDIQKECSTNIDLCKSIYIELMETLDFFEIPNTAMDDKSENGNSFSKWLSETINNFYLKLYEYYNMRYDINQIIRAAQHGILEKDALETVTRFYENIYNIVNIREALLVLKKEMTGKFCALSVKGIGFFCSNTSAINKLENYFNTFIIENGIDDLIKRNDFSKIAKIYIGFKDSFRELINEEIHDYKVFINMLVERYKKF